MKVQTKHARKSDTDLESCRSKQENIKEEEKKNECGKTKTEKL